MNARLARTASDIEAEARVQRIGDEEARWWSSLEMLSEAFDTPRGPLDFAPNRSWAPTRNGEAALRIARQWNAASEADKPALELAFGREVLTDLRAHITAVATDSVDFA